MPARRRCPSNASPKGRRRRSGRLVCLTTNVILAVEARLGGTVVLLPSASEVPFRGIPQIRIGTFRVAVREAMVIRHLVGKPGEIANTFIEDVL